MVCGFQTWPLTLREEHGFGVYGITIQRRICGHRRQEESGELHNEELHNFHSSPNMSFITSTLHQI
jgi:hypothetical protein